MELHYPLLSKFHIRHSIPRDVCHFHFEDTSGDYIAQLREAIEKAGVTFCTLLVDHGDITHADPTTRTSHLDNIRQWIDIAAQVGAERVRVVAGESRADDKDALSLSVSQFNVASVRKSYLGFAGRGLMAGARVC